MKSLKLLDLYIAKNFLVRFFQITFGFSLLISLINLIDLLERMRDSEAPFYSAVFMSFLQVPDFLNEIIPSLVLISAIVSFFLLSSRSEVTVIRVSGLTLWQILRPLAFTAFLLGIIWVTLFGMLSIKMTKKFNALEGQYIRNETREVIAPKGGVWLKQSNVEKPDEYLIIQSKKVYRENLEFDGATIWFFDKTGQFYKKADAEKMILKDNLWLLENVIINDNQLLNKKFSNLEIPTDLKSDFIIQKVVNNFQNVQLFSIFELPSLIADLNSAGFNSTKFRVYLHSLLSKPLLFLAMIFIACYFGLNHVRNNNAPIMIFLGIVVGLMLYITSSIINSLGSSGLIPVFASTWVIAIICLAIGTLLIYNKDNV